MEKGNMSVETPKRYRGKKGDKYFTIMGDGKVTDWIENETRFDDFRYNLGNYFKTEEEALEVLDSVEWKELWRKVRMKKAI